MGQDPENKVDDSNNNPKPGIRKKSQGQYNIMNRILSSYKLGIWPKIARVHSIL